MTQILASGATEAASTSFTLAAGESATLSLFDAAGPVVADDALAHVQYLASNSQYLNIVGGDLTASNPMMVLQAVGTFQVLRRRCSAAFGIDRD